MIVERFNIFKRKEQYVLLLHTDGYYYLLINYSYESKTVISTVNIDNIDFDSDMDLHDIAYFSTIDKANDKLTFIINKYIDPKWRNKDNWSIMTFDDLKLLLSTSKFNI